MPFKTCLCNGNGYPMFVRSRRLPSSSRWHGPMTQKWCRIEISEMAGWINLKLYRRVARTMALNLFNKKFGKIYYRPCYVKIKMSLFPMFLQNSISGISISMKLRRLYSPVKLYPMMCQLCLNYRPLRHFTSEPIAGLRNCSLLYTISLRRAIKRCAIGPAFDLGTFAMVQGRV